MKRAYRSNWNKLIYYISISGSARRTSLATGTTGFMRSLGDDSIQLDQPENYRQVLIGIHTLTNGMISMACSLWLCTTAPVASSSHR